MTTEELGRALAEARTARGLSHHDVERDTRISQKYLKAIEEGDLEILPAPVYARAFVRTYSQYLGLNAGALVQRLPGAKPEPELPPIPEVGRDATAPLLSAGWIATGVVVILLVGLGLLLLLNRDRGGETMTANPPIEETVGTGSEQGGPPDGVLPPPVVEPGVVPDLVGQDVLVAIDALGRADVPYIVVEVESDDAAPGVVFQQSPLPGAATEDRTTVTLMVGR